MFHKKMILCVVLSCAFFSPLQAEEGTSPGLVQAFRNVSPAVVMIKRTIQLEQQKVDDSIPGIVVDKDGLIIVDIAYYTSNPPLPMSAFVSTTVVLDEDGKETRSAKYLGQDLRTGSAFLRIDPSTRESDKKEFVFVDFEKCVIPEVGQDAFVVGILPAGGNKYTRVLGKTYAAGLRPGEVHPFALVGGDADQVGAPVFSLAGDPIGFMAPLPQGPNRQAPAGGLKKAWLGKKFVSAIQAPPDPAAGRRRPWVGISEMQPMTKELAQYHGIEQEDGVVIGFIMQGQPADKAGLKTEDIILKVNGAPITAGLSGSVQALQAIFLQMKSGDNLKLHVFRRGAGYLDVDLALGERPKESDQADTYEIPEGEFNMKVRELVFMDSFQRYLPSDQPGVLVHFLEMGWAADGGLRAGDIIVKVNDVEVRDLARFKEEFAKLLAQKPAQIGFTVLRGALNETIVARVECHWK